MTLQKLSILAVAWFSAAAGCGQGMDAQTTEASTTSEPLSASETENGATEVDSLGETESETEEPLIECVAPEGTVIEVDSEGPGVPLAVTLAGEGVCHLELVLADPRIISLHAQGDVAPTLKVGEVDETEPGWVRPRLFSAGSYPITLENTGAQALEITVATTDYGPPVGEVVRERSLAWTDPELTEGPERCGLSCVLANISEDGHGGLQLQVWFERFSTTAHSERLGPKQMLEAFSGALGPDPATWNLDALPFVVTAFHNRIDLSNGDGCGEFRVSMASTDPIYRPFHLIFLFRQPPEVDDLSPAGVAHCTATGLRWARLSTLEADDFFAEAKLMIDERIHADGFLAAESLEFMISPWEWRQWFWEKNPNPDRGLSQVLDNRPLFQTLDIARLNQPGPEREQFLQWVGDNAEGLNARTVLLPEVYRSASARLNQGVAWVPLDLNGIAPGVLEQYPVLRQQLEIIGCPACHATDAEFVQTQTDRTFSEFYDKELDARGLYLQNFVHGLGITPPHGPLQNEPILPP